MLNENEVNSIQTYLEKNRLYWEGYGNRFNSKNDGVILVDLLVGHPGYLIGNCIVAKYLQERHGHKIIGMVRNNESKLEMAVGKSFGFDEFIYYQSEKNFGININYSFFDSCKNVADIRHACINLNVNNVVLGELAYDSYLRNTGRGTIDSVSPDVLAHLNAVANDFIFYDAVIKQKNIKMAVMGHTVYSMYGSLVRAALHNDIPVFGKKAAAGPLTVRQYKKMEDRRQYEFRLTEGEFDLIYKRKKTEAIEKAKQFLEKRFSGGAGPEDYIDAFGEHKQTFDKFEFLEMLGLDPTKPTVCIMSHIMPDAPFAFAWSVYPDYYVWLESTLKIISEVTHVNWLVKEHPELKFYNPVHTATDVTKPYADKYEHIALVPPDMDTSNLFEFVNSIVTVVGTSGLEFAALGKPALLAGESPYSGFGFTTEAKSEKQYIDYLQNIDQLKPLTQEAKEKALVYVYAFFYFSRVNCVFLPEMPQVFWHVMNYKKIYDQAKMLLEENKVDDDPFYVNFNKQLDLDFVHTFNFDFVDM